MNGFEGRRVGCVCLAAAVIGSLLHTSSALADDKKDLDTLRQRILQRFLAAKVDESRVGEIAKSVTPDGSWGNIDYGDATRSDAWQPMRHLRNLSDLAWACRSPRSSQRDKPELMAAVLASLDHWLTHDYQNTNWWHNRIGVPQQLAPVLLLFQTELTDAQRAKGIEILRRAAMGMTGQNLIWLADITLCRGLLEGDPEVVASALQRITREIRITTDEGIQPDFSFHQHGPCLYSHGYGGDFALDCSRLAALAAGTRFALPQEKVDILCRYLLDGSQWMAFGRAEDYGADGREIARPSQTAAYLAEAARNLLELNTGREEDVKALIARVASQPEAALEGNHCFWRSDFMTHLRRGYYASARMYSSRVDNTDHSHNGEGLRSHHIADGCNFLMVSGREYEDIFPVWDWQKIPGTTVEQTGVFSGSPRRRGTTDFAGGVSDGQYGAAAFVLERDSLHAHKAWFFFDQEYVCLGAGISCDSPNQVLTTVNQCCLDGSVAALHVAGDEEILTEGEHSIEGPATICHGNVAYVFLSDSRITLRNASQEGSWQTISESLSAEPISRKVFLLGIDHGKPPRNGSYAYLVRPGIDPMRTKQLVRESKLEVLSNSPALQAVKHRALRLIQVVFYQAGSLVLDGKPIVEADRPCLLMIRDAGDELQLSVADPTQKHASVGVRVAGRLLSEGAAFDAATGASSVLLMLPTGPLAGATVLRTFKKGAVGL